jgi:hypothetical protein
LAWFDMGTHELRRNNNDAAYWLHLHPRTANPAKERERHAFACGPEPAMNANEENTKSLWMNVAVAPDAPVLSTDVQCDAVVVGPGVAGLSCAYELATAGQNVVVLDRGTIAGGITSRTTAHLTPICDDTISAMTKIRGEAASHLFYESQCGAIDRIEAICEQEAISCYFRRLDGLLFPAMGSDAKEIKDASNGIRCGAQDRRPDRKSPGSAIRRLQ